MMTAGAQNPLALVVEDKALILMETVDLLKEHGFAVVEALNAAQALQRLADTPEVVLLVTNVQMPGAMNGFALAREARRLHPALAIIVCSGRDRPGADELPAQAHFIDKPLSARMLIRTLRLLGHPAPGADPTA